MQLWHLHGPKEGTYFSLRPKPSCRCRAPYGLRGSGSGWAVQLTWEGGEAAVAIVIASHLGSSSWWWWWSSTESQEFMKKGTSHRRRARLSDSQGWAAECVGSRELEVLAFCSIAWLPLLKIWPNCYGLVGLGVSPSPWVEMAAASNGELNQWHKQRWVLWTPT